MLFRSTLSVARLQQRLLDANRPPRVMPTRVDPAAIRGHFGDSGEDCVREFRAKAIDAEEAERLNERLDDSWPALRGALAAVHIAEAKLDAALAKVGAPRRPRELGWSDAFFRTAVIHARQIRNRYTCLDLIDDSAGLGAWLA